MKDVFVDKNDNVFKSQMSLFNFSIIATCLGNILFYLAEENIKYSIFLIIYTIFAIFYIFKINKALSYYISLLIFVIYFVFLSIIFQIHYLTKYGGSYFDFFIFYLILVALVVHDYFSLKKNGVFEKFYKGIAKSVDDVVDVFGERKKYLKVSRLSANIEKIKLFDGSFIFAIILFPILLVSFVFAPFVKSIPVVFAYFVSKNYADTEIVIMYILSFIFNLIVFKYIFVVYGGVMCFLKKK